MSTTTTTSMKVVVDLLTKAATYVSNVILMLAFRVEAGRIQGGQYMKDHAAFIEEGMLVWLRENTLEKVTMELYDPDADDAYETCEVDLVYLANPTEEVVAPQVEELDALFKRLVKLPPGAKFRFLVTTAPNATKIPGWTPTKFKKLRNGIKEKVVIGKAGFGFGHIQGTPVYVIGNWDGPAGDPPGQTE